MHPTAKSALRAAAIVAIGSGLIALYFADNIRGYYRFKELCRTEGGLRVFHQLEKNVGWLAKKDGGYLVPAHLNQVAFVRYTDGSNTYDIRYQGGPTGDERSYAISLANTQNNTTYSFSSFYEEMAGELRTSRSSYEIRETDTNRLMVRWMQIGYSTFDQSKTILAAPSGNSCYHKSVFSSDENIMKMFKQ